MPADSSSCDVVDKDADAASANGTRGGCTCSSPDAPASSNQKTIHNNSASKDSVNVITLIRTESHL